MPDSEHDTPLGDPASPDAPERSVEDLPPEDQLTGDQFPCPQCGGATAFNAKQQALVCTHCGHAEAIEGADAEIVEYDLMSALENAPKGRRRDEMREVKCGTCGAHVEVQPDKTALACGYCDSPVVVVEDDPERIQPESLIPFAISQNVAKRRLRSWLKSRWFRPNDLAGSADLHRLRGRYVPAWTYDAHTESNWTAMAGYHYYDTQWYTDSDGNRRTRRVRRTRWVPASGHYDHFFNDWLVFATKALPDHLLDDLGRWKLSGLEAYDTKFLSGYEAERYRVDLKEGWDRARKGIAGAIRTACARRVPGDTHRALRVRTSYADMRWKHLLLPLWVIAYRYRGKAYRIVINGQTGQVDGEAPLSWAKITLLILGIVALIAVIVTVVMMSQ